MKAQGRFTPERLQAAKEIKTARNMEKKFRYASIDDSMNEEIPNMFRNGEEYIKELLGLANFFDYIRKLPSKKVLDIGIGVGHALDDLSRSKMRKGLTFEGTSLTKTIGDDKRVYITSAEVLRGIPDESFGGIIAVHSLGYSDAPQLVINQINRVLIPGGVIKSQFQVFNEKVRNRVGTIVNKAVVPIYIESLERLGFDVATDSVERGEGLVITIKPGLHMVTAKKLLEKDRTTIKDQLNNII